MGQAGAQLGTSVNYVKDLNTAMEKISGSSEEISKIIATIENIALLVTVNVPQQGREDLRIHGRHLARVN